MSTWKNAIPALTTQYDLKRQILLNEAAATFNHRGFHGTTLAEIADRLGVTKAALYTYVPSKEALLYYCHSSAVDSAIKCLEQTRQKGGTGLEQLTEALRSYMNFMLSKNSGYVLLLEETAMTQDHQESIMKRRDVFERGLRDIVEYGIKDGSIVICNSKLAVFAMLGATNWIYKWFSINGEWSGTQVSTALTELLERSLSSNPKGSLQVDLSKIPTADQFTISEISGK